MRHNRLQDKKYSYEHSDYFSVGHCRRFWLPVLRLCVPDRLVVEKVRTVLSIAVQNVAHLLQVQPQAIRANVFVEQAPGKLSIPKEFHSNMGQTAEAEIEIDVGTGVSGNVFATGKPLIALMHHNWGMYALSESQLQHVHPDLKWVVSTPIRDPCSRWGFSGVVNVDSIGQHKTENELRPVLDVMALHAAALGSSLVGISRIADSRE